MPNRVPGLGDLNLDKTVTYSVAFLDLFTNIIDRNWENKKKLGSMR